MKTGDIIFVRKAKNSAQRKGQEVQFKGHAFALLLGEVPLFQRDPHQGDMLRILGTVGFISFDDVIEFIGDDMAKQLISNFENKYYIRKKPDLEEAPLPPNPSA